MKQACCIIILTLCCFCSFAKKKKKVTQYIAPPVERQEVRPDPFAKSDRITLFQNTVLIQPDGKLLVTEKITIHNGDGDQDNASPEYLEAGGGNDEIKRGIIRTFPTKYLDKYKFLRNTTFRLLDVKMDGATAPWELKGDFGTNGYALRIGDASSFLPNGDYTYTITYETEHQIKFLKQFDELVWNVTGNGWNFRIDSAVCTIILPGRDFGFSNACYTGAMNDTSRNCIASGGGDTVVFRTTQALKPYQGITVASSWKKGLVKPPSWSADFVWFLKNNFAALTMPLLWLLILLYNTYKWWRYGRDPLPGTIIAQYEPPADLSPAATGYIYFQKMKNKLVAATITDLALRNLFTIVVERKGLIIKDNEYSFKKSSLPFEEAGYEDYKDDAEDLMGTVIRKGHYNSQLGDLRKTISKDLSGRYEGSKSTAYFRTNKAYMTLGCVLPFIAGVILFVVISFNAKVNPWAFIPLGIGILLCTITQAIFSRLMPTYTKAGREKLDYIEGYRMYLKAVDENRLNTMNPPERTIDLFEKNLAYAIALDCEVEWGKKFEGIINTAIEDGTAHAALYYSNSMSGSGFSSESFVSGFSGAVSSASTPPSSSSGGGSSFGGGSSGSGGGGGGGGGW
jgi:uncharacterized membrane protein YgcG